MAEEQPNIEIPVEENKEENDEENRMEVVVEEKKEEEPSKKYGIEKEEIEKIVNNIKEVEISCENALKTFDNFIQNYDDKLFSIRDDPNKPLDGKTIDFEKNGKTEDGSYLDDSIQQGYNMIDKLDEVNEAFPDLMEKIATLSESCTEVYHKSCEKFNELIEKVEKMKEEKTKIEIERFKKKTVNLKPLEYNSMKTKLESKRKESMRQIEGLLNEEDIHQIEVWTKSKVIDVVFDTDKQNDWSVENTTFHEKLINKSNLIMVILDTAGFKFGGYIQNKITETENWTNDPNTFLFTLTPNNVVTEMTKYQVVKKENAFFLAGKENEVLFNFGDNLKVMKSNKKHESNYTGSANFQYEAKSDPIRGKKGNFTPSRIVVLQMELNKTIQDVIGTELRPIDTLNGLLNKVDCSQFKVWTERKIEGVLFDSYYDDWGINSSVLNEKVSGKSHLLFLILDENERKFGGYCEAQIAEPDNFTNDPKCFLFSLVPNNIIFDRSRFLIKNNSNGIKVFQKNVDDLFSFGGDMLIKKYEKRNESNMNENSNNYNYQGLTNPIRGSKGNFTAIRVVVIQMK